jgi:hypothetical protein
MRALQHRLLFVLTGHCGALAPYFFLVLDRIETHGEYRFGA